MTTQGPSIAARRLPPLNALRAFEASARHLSITDAARELAVTTGAVSQQIRLLEEHAGGALFNREPRAVTLTELGAELYPILRTAFEHMQRASDLVYRPAGRRQLTITAPASFASKWLAPRLQSFSEANPDIDVSIAAEQQPGDLSGGRIDIAILLTRHVQPEFKAEQLLPGDLIPVCSPALLEGADALRAPEDIARHTLIHVRGSEHDEGSPDWGAWLAERALSADDMHASVRVDRNDIAIEMAAHGRGVALAPRALVAADIAQKRLVAPLADGLIKSALRYFVVTRKSNVPESARKFVRWIVDESNKGDQVSDEL